MATPFHGVFISESPTSITPPVLVDSAVQVAVGIAPVHLGGCADPLAPQIAYTYGEAVEKLGFSEDFERYPLCQVMRASFVLYGVSPVVFINVLDPASHTEALSDVSVSITEGACVLRQEGVLLDSLTVKSEDGGETYQPDRDYTLNYNPDGHLVVTILEEGTIDSAQTALLVSGKRLAPSLVEERDVLAGIERIREVYPRFNIVPGTLLAPGWSHRPEIGLALSARCTGLNGLFRCTALWDIDPEAADSYDKVNEVKNTAGSGNPMTIALWPRLRVGDSVYCFSAVAGAHIAYTDYQNGGVPYVSPSNKELKISGICDGAGREIVLDYEQANLLNQQGVCTANNLNGWKFWGNRTAAFPGSTDPKDTFIPVRRMFNWWANTFILTYFDRVDSPMNKRLVDAVVDSENIRANGYKARYQLADARIEFREEDNPETDLLGGVIRFKQYLTPYPPAETIINDLEFDPYALSKSLYK